MSIEGVFYGLAFMVSATAIIQLLVLGVLVQSLHEKLDKLLAGNEGECAPGSGPVLTGKLYWNDEVDGHDKTMPDGWYVDVLDGPPASLEPLLQLYQRQMVTIRIEPREPVSNS